MEFNPSQIAAVVDLFKTEDDESDGDEDKPVSGTASAMGPGNIGPQRGSQASTKAETVTDSKDIWSEAEVPEGAEYDQLYDPRPQPEYDILYSQSVTSEDIFLQMGNKTPMTASCENMTVKIKLPGAKMAEVELDVKSKFLDCRTPKYKLGLHLPHPVDHKNGKAQWDAKTETLIGRIQHDKLAEPLTEKEVAEAIQKPQPNKAPGPDGIPPEVFKEGGPILLKELTSLFQAFWELDEVPQEFKDANIVHLYKNNAYFADLLLTPQMQQSQFNLI